MRFAVQGSSSSVCGKMMRVFALVFLCVAARAAMAQAPYVLPSTITTLIGPAALRTGTFPQACSSGSAFLAYNGTGDGCPASQVDIGTDGEDVRVDGLGNVYWLDNSGTSAISIHKYNPFTGLVTIYAGGASTVVCAAKADKYGDNCIASDNQGNLATDATSVGGTYAGYTATLAGRGLGIAPNNDLYLASYNVDMIMKISYATHTMSLIAGASKVATYVDSVPGCSPSTTPCVLATNGTESSARGVGVDPNNNVYIADTGNFAVREVYPTASGVIISTVGGSHPVSSGGANTSGYTNGPEANSLFNSVADVQTDSFGNVYAFDFGNDSVRALYLGSGTIPNNPAPLTVGNWYTVVGNGTGTSTGITEPTGPQLATNVAIGGRKIALDKYNNLYIADTGNDVIWFVDHVTGFLRILAGSYKLTTGGAGCAAQTNANGDGCLATLATIAPSALPGMGVFVDQAQNMYLSDTGAGGIAGRIRKIVNGENFGSVNTGATVTQSILVHVNPVGGVGGAADTLTSATINSSNADFTVASIPTPTSNNDNTNDYALTVQFKPTKPGLNTAPLKVVTNSGLSSSFTLSGIGVGSSVAIDPGSVTKLPAASSAFVTPAGTFMDAAGNVYIADSGSNRVFFYNASASTTTVIAGTGTASFSGDNAAATAATLNKPTAVTADAAGNVYIADTGNNAVRRIDAVSGKITTYAGGPSATVCTNVIASPDAVGNGCPGTQAILNKPAGVALDSIGNLYISDQTAGGATIRVVSTNGFVNAATISGVCSAKTDVFGDGCNATGGTSAVPTGILLNSPAGLTIDSSNNLYIADPGNNVVHKMNLGTTLVTLVAGNGQAGASVSSGSVAALSQLNAPQAVAVDAGGNVYIADTGNSSIRMVTAGTGLISTIAGINSASGTGTVPGAATQAQFAAPAGVAVNGVGTMIIADSGNARVLSDNRTQVAYNFGITNVGAQSPAIPFTEVVTGNAPVLLGTPLFNTSGSTSTDGSTGIFTLKPSTTNGCAASATTTMPIGATCGLVGQFSPATTTYPTFLNATYTESHATVSNPAAPQIVLSGAGLVQINTTTGISQTAPATGNPQFGGTLTLKATITPASCAPSAPICAPTGTVTFIVDGIAQAPITLTANPGNATSSASQTITTLSVGSHTVVVSYSGDTFYASSTSSTSNITVTTAATSTTVSLAPASSSQFTDVVFTATVMSTTTGTPTGTVTFYSNGAAIPTGTNQPLDSSGKATFTETLKLNADGTQLSNTTQAPGTYSITAVYGNATTGAGDANFSYSTSAASTLTVTANTPVIQLASKACNEAAVILGTSGVNFPTVASQACPTDPGSNQRGTPLATNGVAKSSSGVTGGNITQYQICPAPLNYPCLVSSQAFPNPNPATFVDLVTFTEPNSFSPGQAVTITGSSILQFNIGYVVIAATPTTWTAVLNSDVATAQGATTDATIFVRPSNTLTGTITFSCTGLPANAACTFNPTTLTLTPSSATPAYIPVVATFFTDLQPGTGGTSSLRAPALPGRNTPGVTLALMLGWPITLAGLAGLIRFRKRARRALTLVALLCMLAGSSLVFSGCGLGGPGAYKVNFTPAGTYPITITATNGTVSQSIIVNFTVTSPGIPGQE